MLNIARAAGYLATETAELEHMIAKQLRAPFIQTSLNRLAEPRALCNCSQV